MRKIISIFAVVLSIAMMFSACGGGKPAPASGNSSPDASVSPVASESQKAPTKENVTITYLTGIPLYAKNGADINAEFQKTNPNITVKIEHVSDNYEAVLKTKLVTENPPDIFNWQGYLAMKPFVEGGQVVSLDGTGIEAMLYPNFVESGKMDGKFYGVPTQIQTIGLLYNKDVFKKAGVAEVPKTVSALKEAVTKINAIGVQPFASGLKEQWVCYDLFWFAQSPHVGDMLSWNNDMNAGKGTFMNDNMPAMFELFDFIYANSGSKAMSSDFAEMCHQIASGTAAMGIQGDWSYEETMKIDPNANVGMIGLPIDENAENATVLADVAEVLYVSSASKNQEAAQTFIKWILSKEGATFLGAMTKTPSPSNAKPDIELNPFARDGSQWVADGKKTAIFAWDYWAPGIMDIAGKNLQAYFTKAMTLEELVADLDAQWAKTIKK